MVRPREHTREEFLEIAFQLVDSEGIEALTARRLGIEVGVSPSAVYTYFATREDLVNALVGYLSMQIINRAVVKGDTPKAQIMAIAVSTREVLREHSRLAPIFLVSNSVVGDGHQSTHVVLSMLESAGLSGTKLVNAFRTLESYVLGATIFDLGAAPLHISIRRERYKGTGRPELMAVAKSDVTMKQHNEDAFQVGLSALLDGLGIV